MTIRNGIHAPAGTPVPSTNRETSGAGPVKTYQLTPEELAKYQALGKPGDKKPVLWAEKPPTHGEESDVRSRHTKEEYLQLRLEGKTRDQIAMEWGIKLASLQNYLLNKWGIYKQELEVQALRAFAGVQLGDSPKVPTSVLADPKNTGDVESASDGASTSAVGDPVPAPGTPQTDTAQPAPVQAVDRPGASPKKPELEPSDSSPVTDNSPADSAPVTDNSPATDSFGETIVKLAFKTVAESVHQIAVSKGWHESPVPFPTALALIHSEVSEALDAHRKQRGADKVAEELADIVIRVFDTSEAEGIDLVNALFAKMAKNRERAWRHGGLLY